MGGTCSADLQRWLITNSLSSATGYLGKQDGLTSPGYWSFSRLTLVVKLLICTTLSLLDTESTQKILLKKELSDSLNVLFQRFQQRITNGQIYSVGQQQIFKRFTELQLMPVGQQFPFQTQVNIRTFCGITFGS